MPKDKMYTLRRKELAQKIAAHASGFEDAVPEQFDLDLADEVIELINKRLDDLDALDDLDED